MSSRKILIRECGDNVPTIRRVHTTYERTHRDKDLVQLWIAIALMVGPVGVVIWEILR